MKKLFSIIALSLFALLMIFSFVSKSALADGMVIMRNPYLDHWNYSYENNQQVFINYDNNLQKMIISIGLGGKNNSGVVWLFPIPSNPNKVAIDVVGNLPQLGGEEISGKAKSNLNNTTDFLQATQIYTIPLIISSMLEGNPNNGPTISGVTGASPKTKRQGTERDVVVYKHLEKEGMISEIITAKTADGLYNYLKNKGLKIESGSIPVLNNYIGKEYSFVVSWINPSKDVISGQRGIFVTFPTQDIYFPMLPTSVYGSKIIPVTIRIIGYVSPKIFQTIKNYTKTKYYIGDYSSVYDLKNFYSGQNQNIKYTKIKINAPSNLLTDDLWISRQAPLKTYYSTFVARYPIVTTIILLILSSILTGILVGLIIFRELRKNITKLGLIGLSNCLSIFGLLMATVLISTKKKNESIDPLLAKIKQKGYVWKRKLATVLLFVYFPFLIFGAIFLNYIPQDSISDFHRNAIIPIIISVIPLLVFLVFGLFIRKRIKPEDKDLFEQLKLNNYSSWSFQPKDKMKIVFIPVFSISFLIISWLLVELVKFTV